MKTHGICNAQSARKHRRAGHLVQRFPDGRYQWQSQGTPQLFGRAVRPPRTIAGLLQMTASAIQPIAVGASYWPKRRNQYSKPYRVEALSNDGTIYFTRGDNSPTQQMGADAFLALIGKPV